MRPILEDGVLYIPMRAESEDGKDIGDGMVPIDESHPDYKYWMGRVRSKAKVVSASKQWKQFLRGDVRGMGE